MMPLFTKTFALRVWGWNQIIPAIDKRKHEALIEDIQDLIRGLDETSKVTIQVGDGEHEMLTRTARDKSLGEDDLGEDRFGGLPVTRL